MISSMTGYGRGEARNKQVAAAVEVRGVNSRFLEVNAKLPAALNHREGDIKEVVRTKISRGKVTVVISLERPNSGEVPLRINRPAAKAYYSLLGDLRKTLKLKDKISLGHLLKFSEVFEAQETDEGSEEQWKAVEEALVQALVEFNAMRQREGEELRKDLHARIGNLDQRIDAIERLSKEQVPGQRARLQQRMQELLQDRSVVDSGRLELEIALLADKLDVTEECVRFRSHNKVFLESLADGEAAGRKLNFLVQEMNREANTIGSKAGDVQIAHIVVSVKEEIEKIREQLQNIE